MSIKRNINKSIRAFTERVQTHAAQFDENDYEVNPKSLSRWWRKCLGSNFHTTNKIVNETVILPDSWSDRLPLLQLVDKWEVYLRARGVEDADDNKKDEEKQDGRKTCQNDEDKDPDLQGHGGKKVPQYGTTKVTQQQPDPEVENWQKHVKHHIFQNNFITDQHLEVSSWFAGKYTSGCYYCSMDNHNHEKCGKLKYLNSKAQIEYDQHYQRGSSNTPMVHSLTTPPGVPHGARRVQNETEK